MKPESDITYITGYSGFISCELFLIAWGRTHTHTHTSAQKVILRNQVCAAVAGLKMTTLSIYLYKGKKSILLWK